MASPKVRTNKLNGWNPLAYMGVAPSSVSMTAIHTQPPTPNDSRGHSIGEMWIVDNPDLSPSYQAWLLVGFEGTGASFQAIWFPLGSGGGSAETTIETPHGNATSIDNVVQFTSLAGTVTISGASNAVNFEAVGINGILPVSSGGTGVNAFGNPYGVVYVGPDRTTLLSTTNGSAGLILTANGAGEAPSYQAFGAQSGLTEHAVVIAQGDFPFVASNVGTANAMLMGNGAAADPAFTTTGTPYCSGISFNNGADTLIRYNGPVSWTPVIYGSTSAGVGTYTSQHGTWSRIGDIVFIQVNLEWTAHTGTGDMLIGGFPFIFAHAASYYPFATLIKDLALPAGALWVVVDGDNNTTYAEVTANLNNANSAPVEMSNTGGIYFQGMYFTDPTP